MSDRNYVVVLYPVEGGRAIVTKTRISRQQAVLTSRRIRVENPGATVTISQ